MGARKYCIECGNGFLATNAWHKYCSKKCKTANQRKRKGIILSAGRFCKQCGKQFYPDLATGHNQQHCSQECSSKSARESRSKFWDKFGDKKKKQMQLYYDKSKAKCGTDSNLKRFYNRYPDAPKACQSCGESRVLDIAHKPRHKRNGAWGSKHNTAIERVWILCPTCHALLDRKGYEPSQLNLS